MPQGELAVIVRDSVAPDPSRRWRVLVEGPMHGLNGFGAGITVTAIRFDGYYVPPPPTPEELAQQEAARKAWQARQAVAEKAEAEAQARQHEWVEQEVARREAEKLEQYKRDRQAYCDTLAQGEAASNTLNARIAAANPGWAKAQAKAEAQVRAAQARLAAKPNKNAEEAAQAAAEAGDPHSLWKTQHCDDTSQEPALSAWDKDFIRRQVESEKGEH